MIQNRREKIETSKDIIEFVNYNNMFVFCFEMSGELMNDEWHVKTCWKSTQELVEN